MNPTSIGVTGAFVMTPLILVGERIAPLYETKAPSQSALTAFTVQRVPSESLTLCICGSQAGPWCGMACAAVRNPEPQRLCVAGAPNETQEPPDKTRSPMEVVSWSRGSSAAASGTGTCRKGQ